MARDPFIDSNSFTGSDRPLLTETEDIANDRRRLRWLLPDGSRHVVTVDMSEDSDDYRKRIGDALMEDLRGRIRGGKIVNSEQRHNR